ncbi:hypothetical protein GGU11DRAFT_761324 [Lentinula aff. detonsa]|uniref:Uncharacterized protein n=1 Tax=Lentinula aff. detonsa TaxID=2804958 RepID=A0AA38KB66_9AGAR|nr:hypothetical protein GGU10DRAFT_399153 [Lentinula aff. detonsa]KAJ3791769.1 hypothetical protein GGU11DRAFT_761324 [Lentinula aff. detonsa]
MEVKELDGTIINRVASEVWAKGGSRGRRIGCIGRLIKEPLDFEARGRCSDDTTLRSLNLRCGYVDGASYIFASSFAGDKLDIATISPKRFEKVANPLMAQLASRLQPELASSSDMRMLASMLPYMSPPRLFSRPFLIPANSVRLPWDTVSNEPGLLRIMRLGRGVVVVRPGVRAREGVCALDRGLNEKGIGGGGFNRRGKAVENWFVDTDEVTGDHGREDAIDVLETLLLYIPPLKFMADDAYDASL